MKRRVEEDLELALHAERLAEFQADPPAEEERVWLEAFGDVGKPARWDKESWLRRVGGRTLSVDASKARSKRPERADVRAVVMGILLRVSVLLGALMPVLLLWSLAGNLRPQQVELTVTSDPLGAQVYIAGEPRGTTPLTVRVPAGRDVAYRLVAEEPYQDYQLYKPYEGRINISEPKRISVWLDRTTAEEQLAQRAPLLLESWRWYHGNGLTIVEGEVTNRGARSLENVEAVVEFFTRDDVHISFASSLLDRPSLLPGETSPFRIYVSWNPAISRAVPSFREARGSPLPWAQE